jgi:hypothetical protein
MWSRDNKGPSISRILVAELFAGLMHWLSYRQPVLAAPENFIEQ